MAMTKKEKQMIEDLKAELSFHRTYEKIEPDIFPPEDSGKLSLGYHPIGVFSSYFSNGRAEKYCSSCIHHGSGWEKTTSQQKIPLYKTRLKALKKLRQMAEAGFTKTLRSIDVEIEKEIENPSEPGKQG